MSQATSPGAFFVLERHFVKDRYDIFMDMNKKRQVWRFFAGCFIAILLTLGTAVYVGIIEVCAGKISAGNIWGLVQGAVYNPRYIAMFGMILLIVVSGKWKTALLLIYQHRFLFAGLIFVICILLEINGSSIGMWSLIFGEADPGILAGASRSLRTDEWAVSTPMALSQYYDAAGPFSYFSHVVRGTATDVFLEYGQPVRDIAVLFRPFHWGYLFLSPGKALSFFWCGRFIGLFLVSFEFGMLLTENRKRLAGAYAMLMAFAPVVQWWFAVNGLLEMLIYIQLSILMLVKYMRTESYRIRSICIITIVICAGGYVFTMYPAWMVPLAYVLLGLGIWAFMENIRDCRMRKADWLMILAGILVLGLLSGYILLKSGDTIEAMMNTAYPGKRFKTGGTIRQEICNYVSNIWYAMNAEYIGTNVCESSQFTAFFPMCYILPVYVIWREKNKDRLLRIMLPISIFLGIWVVIGFPKIFAKYTLMSYTTDLRTLQIIGVVNLILIFRSMAVMHKAVKRRISLPLAALSGVGVVYAGIILNDEFFGVPEFVVTLIVFTAAFYLALRIPKERAQNVFVAECCLLALVSGLLVNPIRQGVDNIYDLEIVQKIQRIQSEDPEALWISEGLGFPFTEISIVTGAPTLNSTNVYPAMETWRKLDPEGKYEKIYNRYAHIKILIKDEGQAEFQMNKKSPDNFWMSITIADLEKLGVKYIFTNTMFDSQKEKEYNLELLDEWKGFRIYKMG